MACLDGSRWASGPPLRVQETALLVAGLSCWNLEFALHRVLVYVSCNCRGRKRFVVTLCEAVLSLEAKHSPVMRPEARGIEEV